MDALENRLADAKKRLSEAAAACLENRPGAADEADAAQADVQAALALQRAARRCAEPGCNTITLHDRCERHR